MRAFSLLSRNRDELAFVCAPAWRQKLSKILRSSLRMGRQDLIAEECGDGSMLLQSPQRLAPHAAHVSQWLSTHAMASPERTFLAERTANGSAWRHLTYADAAQQTSRVAQGLLDRGLSSERPLMILSENSINHALLMLGAMHVGIPVVPVSTAYSLMDRTFAKLRQVHELVQPGLVFAEDPMRYADALGALAAESPVFSELSCSPPSPMVDELHRTLAPDAIAKILFTSGSTGTPKGVINTQRMLTANQQQSLQIWPFLGERPPVVVDWLPWNHTFGGNYNFNMVLSNGGTMYIDAGRPMPNQIDTTVRNLIDVSPTMYFNVPRGFELLLPFLENNSGLRRSFFSRCEFIFYAAAALPQNLWTRLVDLACSERGGDLALVSAWGSTETAPLCTAVHYGIDRAGIIGLPVPGVQLKLVPNGEKLEARVRGPNVTPGYFRSPEATAAAFDDEGYYAIGDALRLADPDYAEKGLKFDGRVAEDFKLSTGTWVNAGKLRVSLLEASDGLVQDAVITGHGLEEIGALVFLSASVTSRLDAEQQREQLAAALTRQQAKAGSGSSHRIARALILTEQPRADLGEVTDKGYINQRAVLQNRSGEVERLHSQVLGDDVVVTKKEVR